MSPGNSITRTAGVLLMVVATFVIHGHVLDRFWLDDDPQVLLHATRYGPFETALDLDALQELSASNYTPLVTISFDADLALFGLNPTAFYAHQLLVVALCAIAIQLLLVVYGYSQRLALLAAMVFLVAPPTIHVAGHLMTRHYTEGLLLALLSIIFWRQSSFDAGSRWWLATSVAAYVGSLLAKEVFLLLPLAIVAFGIGTMTWRRLALVTTPYFAALLGYLLLRSWMLGGEGGYGTANPVTHLASVTGVWGARNPAVAIWFAILVIVSGAAWARSRAGALRCGLVILAAGAPLAGVGDALEPRHLLVPAVAVVCGAVSGISRFERERTRLIAATVVVIAGVTAAVPVWMSSFDEGTRMEAEGRYVWEERDDAAPLLGASPGWYLDGIAELDTLWRDETSPRVLYSSLGLAMLARADRYVVVEEGGVLSTMPLADISPLTGYVSAAPIEIEIAREHRMLRWTFGPECDCEWTFYSHPDYQGFVVPREGRRVVPLPREQQWFRVRRREPDGEWTMSPPLRLPRDGETIRWRRPRDRSEEKR